jgi:hypothetical protein
VDVSRYPQPAGKCPRRHQPAPPRLASWRPTPRSAQPPPAPPRRIRRRPVSWPHPGPARSHRCHPLPSRPSPSRSGPGGPVPLPGLLSVLAQASPGGSRAPSAGQLRSRPHQEDGWAYPTWPMASWGHPARPGQTSRPSRPAGPGRPGSGRSRSARRSPFCRPCCGSGLRPFLGPPGRASSQTQPHQNLMLRSRARPPRRGQPSARPPRLSPARGNRRNLPRKGRRSPDRLALRQPVWPVRPSAVREPVGQPIRRDRLSPVRPARVNRSRRIRYGPVR